MLNMSIFRILAVVVVALVLSLDVFAQMENGRGLMRIDGIGRVVAKQRSPEMAMVNPTAPVQTYGTQNRRLSRHRNTIRTSLMACIKVKRKAIYSMKTRNTFIPHS